MKQLIYSFYKKLFKKKETKNTIILIAEFSTTNNTLTSMAKLSNYVSKQLFEHESIEVDYQRHPAGVRMTIKIINYSINKSVKHIKLKRFSNVSDWLDDKDIGFSKYYYNCQQETNWY